MVDYILPNIINEADATKFRIDDSNESQAIEIENEKELIFKHESF